METTSFAQMALCSSLSACLSETITLPIDTAKVRMQVMTTSSAVGARRIGFLPLLAKMAKEEGITSWWKGLTAGLHRQMVYATLRISMYPHIRDFARRQSYLAYVPDLGVKLIAGMASGAIGMTVANPTDVVKIRLQSAITAEYALKLGNSPIKNSGTIYRGALHAYSTIIREEGVLGLWRGLSPNILRNMIVCAAEMVAYDEIKRISLNWLPDGLPCHCVAGFGAGFMATVAGSPVDVVKTRYMNARQGQYSNVLHCLYRLTADEGFLGFYKGFMPNLLRLGSFNLLVFVFYEQMIKKTQKMDLMNKADFLNIKKKFPFDKILK